MSVFENHVKPSLSVYLEWSDRLDIAMTEMYSQLRTHCEYPDFSEHSEHLKLARHGRKLRALSDAARKVENREHFALFVITLTRYQNVGMNLHDEVLEIIGKKHEMVFFDDDPHQWPQPLDDCYNRLFVSAFNLRREARYICDLAAGIAVEDARISERITALAKPWSQTQTAVALKYGTTRQAVAKRVKRLFPERESSAKLSKPQTIILCVDLEKRPPRRKNQKKN